jgi:hypothetical protein
MKPSSEQRSNCRPHREYPEIDRRIRATQKFKFFFRSFQYRQNVLDQHFAHVEASPALVLAAGNAGAVKEALRFFTFQAAAALADQRDLLVVSRMNEIERGAAL